MANKKGGKPAKERTPAMVALDTAGEHLKAAKEALDKNDNVANQNRVKTAEEAVKNARSKVNRERFLSIGEQRVGIAVTKMRAVTRIANRKLYEFTADDAKELTDALKSELKTVTDAFERALAPSNGGEKKASAFTFSAHKA